MIYFPTICWARMKYNFACQGSCFGVPTNIKKTKMKLLYKQSCEINYGNKLSK
jgi:hypothetical protein